MADKVDHPSHYDTGQFECIEVMEEALGRACDTASADMAATWYFWSRGRRREYTAAGTSITR